MPVFLLYLAQRIPDEMHLASQPDRSLEVPVDRIDQPAMIIRDHVPNTGQSAFLQLPEHVRPACLALGIRAPDSQHFPVAVRIDAYNRQHATGYDRPVVPNLLVQRIFQHLLDRMPQQRPHRIITIAGTRMY